MLVHKWLYSQLVDENGVIPAGAREHAVEQAEALSPRFRPYIAGDVWQERGPDNNSGRAQSLAVDPTNANIIYQGTAGGGVWKTTDGGATWLPISDSFKTLPVGSITIDPGNHNTLYAGTGEGWFNNDAIYGFGIYKSTNAGATWMLLANTVNFGNVDKIAVSPSNSNNILVGVQGQTTNAIYRSTDGGSTWTPVYSGIAASAQICHSIEFCPLDATKVVAGTLEFDTGWFNSALFSTNGGATWARATTGIVHIGPPPAGIGSVVLTWAAGSTTDVWASAPTAGSSNVTVYKSIDGGANYTATGTFAGNGQNWYDNCIWAGDPSNPSLVVVGDTYIWRSTNAGVNFTRVNNQGVQTIIAHPDIHAITPHPGYNGTTNKQLFFATDGGVYTATDITLVTNSSNANWARLDQNAHTTQYFFAAGDGPTNKIVGGLQDNATLMLNSTANNQSVWLFGGDGGDVAIDSTDSTKVYGEYVRARVWRDSTGGTVQGSGSYIYSPTLTDAVNQTANFISPFILDPNQQNTLLVGGASLWRNTAARTGSTFTNIKAALGSDYISAIAVAPGNSDLIYVAHNSGKLFKTVNGTAVAPTWTVVDDNSATNPLPNRYITNMLVDPSNPSVVYVCLGGYSNWSAYLSNNLWKTADGGTTWTALTGLPAAPVYAIARKPSDANTLYAGTDVGLFSSSNGGTVWTATSDFPANCPVRDLRYMNNSATLIAATHGRGVWALPAQSVSCPVTLQSWLGPMNVPTLQVEIRDGSNAVVQSFPSVNLDAGGNLLLTTNVPPGTYTVSIKGVTRFLRKNIPGVVMGYGSVAIGGVTLLNGDVNGSNNVSLSDFTALRNSFNLSVGDPGYNDNADLNGSGSVGLADFTILRTNFNVSGDN